MRKQSIIVRCDGDGCKEVGEVADLRETPAGWYRIQQAGENLKIDPNVGFDFHSLRCIEKWANARRRIQETQRVPAATASSAEIILSTLNDMGELTSAEIQDLTGLAQSTVDRQLPRLINEHLVEQFKGEKGNSKNPAVYRVVDHEEG